MQANLTRIYGSVLKAGNLQFLVPVYQRNYSWTEDICQMLFDDIMKIYDGTYSKHFIGSIVYKQEDGNVGRVNVIDGQQRLTTLFLLCKALRDVSDEEWIKNEMDAILVNRWENFNSLVPIKSDNEVYCHILNDNLDLIVRKDSRMYQNYMFFCKQLNSNNIDFKLFVQSLEKLDAVIMTLHNDDDSQIIFESINSTGLNLTNADLIRNYLLMDLNFEEQNYYFEEFWFKFEYYLGLSGIDEFFEHFLAIKSNSKSISRNKLYSVFKEYCRTKESTKEVFEELMQYVNVYKYLRNEELEYQLSTTNNTKTLARLIHDLNLLNTNVSRMFLMEILTLHSKSEITDEDLIFTFELIISYIFRRSACSYPTSALNKIFRFLYSQITRSISKLGYRDALIYNLICTKENTNGKFPSNEEFYEELTTRNLYGKFKNLPYMLLTIENYNNKSRVSSDDISIEHILPQSITNDWKEMLGEDYENTHLEEVHRLGNLTLTSYNSNLSNRSFSEKKSLLLEESHFKLNQYFHNCNTWNKQEIKKRSDELSKLSQNIWAYPDIRDDLLNDVERGNFKNITLGELIEQYTSYKYKSININNEYIKDVSTLRALYASVVEYVCEIDFNKFRDYFIDNETQKRVMYGEVKWYFSYDKDKSNDGLFFEKYGFYIGTSVLSGIHIISKVKDIYEVFDLDPETTEFTVLV